jgi:hypothetical protein
VNEGGGKTNAFARNIGIRLVEALAECFVETVLFIAIVSYGKENTSI